jgi:lipocalin
MKWYYLLLIFSKFISIYAFPENINNFELSKYMGNWYQIYTDQFIKSSILREGSCITANYSLINNKSFNIYSQMNLMNRTISISGIGIINNLLEPEKMDIIFDYGGNGENWIYSLGPIYNDLYDYVIISDSHKISLFVLTRNIERYNLLYNKTVINYIKENDFPDPILINQNDCKI